MGGVLERLLPMKTKLMRSKIGRSICFAKPKWQLRLVSMYNPEMAGILSNAIIADRLISRISPKGGTFLDIGAQYGAVFSLARQFDQTLQVHAFEAEPGKADALKAAYPYARVHCVAVGERDGETSFYLNSKASGYNTLVPGEELKEVTVRMATIDSEIPDVEADVIKIDIEGAELGALRGAKKSVERNRPVIMFECVLPEENSLGYSAERIWDWFNEREYTVLTPDRVAHDAPPLSRSAFIDAQQYPFRSHNYFAVASERKVELRDSARLILGVV